MPLKPTGSSSWRRGTLARAGYLSLLTCFALAGFTLGQGGVVSTAQAAAKRRVGVSVSGTPAGPIREAIGDVLKKHGFEATSPDLSSDSEDAISSAAKQGKLAAVIVGEVRDGGKRVKLRVYSSSGELIGEGSWAEKGGPKKLGATVERTLWARVGGSLSKARPPAGGGGAAKAEKAEPAARAEPEEAPAEEAPTYSRSKDADAEAAPEERETRSKKAGKKKRSSEDAEAESSPSQSASAGPALEVQIGPRFVWRDLSWQPGAASGLQTYSLGHAPAVGATLAWFPAAHVTGGWASNLGVALSAEYIPGVVSSTADGMKYPTQASDYNGGLRGRLAFGPVRAALTLGGGQQAFMFRSGSGSSRDNLKTPDVKYTYARVGGDFRIALPANLALFLGGGYRYVVSAGEQNYLLQGPLFLPSSTVSGFDVAAAVGYRFWSAVEARVGFDMRQYKITAGSNTYMVTGGTDRYTALWAALAVSLEGATGGSPPASKKAEKSSDKSDDKDEDSDAGE